jgi:hypothetical protein
MPAVAEVLSPRLFGPIDEGVGGLIRFRRADNDLATGTCLAHSYAGEREARMSGKHRLWSATRSDCHVGQND